MKMNFSLDAAILITFISALLFMVGQVHLGSYLKIFGVDLSILNLSIQDKLHIGYLLIFPHIQYFLLFLIIIFFIPYIYYSLELHRKLTNSLNALTRKFIIADSHKPPIHNSLQIDSVEKFQNKRIFSIYLISIILIGGHSYLYYTQENAKKVAVKNLDNSSSGLSKVILKTAPTEKAYKIYCGQSFCAVLTVTNQQKFVKYIEPKEIIIPITTP